MKMAFAAAVVVASQIGSAQVKNDVRASTHIAWLIELDGMDKYVAKFDKDNNSAEKLVEVAVVVDGKREDMTFEEFKRRVTARSPVIWGYDGSTILPVLKP